MYGMNGYQPPLVPQSAVTFGEERLVDPWAETMLRNTCSNFQVQNMALQQENAALKTKNQSLQQQRANSIFKVADRAYLREFSAYRTEHFVKFPDERYYLVRENGFGAPYEVTKPLSDCTEFSARYVFDPRDGSTLIEVQYRLPNGKRASFSIPAEKFRKNTLAQSFYKGGGTLHFGKDGPRLFYMLIAQLLSSRNSCILSIPGWNFNNSRWTFKESATCESILNSPILPTAGLASENQRMMSLVVGLSLLKTHFGEAMQPTKPYAMISESFSVTTEITLNCRLSELKKQLYNHRDDLLVYIHDGSNSSRHQKTTNYGFLSDEAVKGSASRSIYIVLARKLTPEIRENCIPIIPAEICSTTDAASANWNDLISLTENNPDEFNLRTQRAYEEACSNFKGSDYCQDAAVLSVVSEIICWTFSRTDATHQRERKFQDTYKQTLEKYVQYWDSLADASALERFRDALYAAARKQSIRFRAIGNIDETYCKEMEVLYDEYKLYITLDLVKSLVSEYMSEFLVSDVLAQLSEAGILSDSIVKTLTLSSGHPKNVRLRSINRSFVNGHGRRDITTI
jgi:predicted ester cyclase